MKSRLGILFGIAALLVVGYGLFSHVLVSASNTPTAALATLPGYVPNNAKANPDTIDPKDLTIGFTDRAHMTLTYNGGGSPSAASNSWAQLINGTYTFSTAWYNLSSGSDTNFSVYCREGTPQFHHASDSLTPSIEISQPCVSITSHNSDFSGNSTFDFATDDKKGSLFQFLYDSTDGSGRKKPSDISAATFDSDFKSSAVLLIGGNASDWLGFGSVCDSSDPSVYYTYGNWICSSAKVTTGSSEATAVQLDKNLDATAVSNFNISLVASNSGDTLTGLIPYLTGQSGDWATQADETYKWCGSSPTDTSATGFFVSTSSYGDQSGDQSCVVSGPTKFLDKITGVTPSQLLTAKTFTAHMAGRSVTIAGTDSSITTAPITTPPPADAAASEAALDCGGGSLNWIVCPLITAAQGAAEKLDGFISNVLTLTKNQTFATSYYKAWGSFRIMASALILIAGLIMVASQAMGIEILDAYTVRKTLPRLIVAIIGISLSWPLMEFTVDLFNTIGQDISGLILGPFLGIHATVNPGIGFLSTILAPVAGVAALFIFGPSALLIIVSGLLGLFIAFMTLVIRQIAVSALVILAPIAIACYILPNTQKAWNIWRENFLGLMMMYPIVMAFIATGHAFATVAIHNGGGLSTILGIIAYFIPYFLLPLAFRLATGIIGNISGMINDRGKGVFDRMKNFRHARAAENWQNTRSGHRFAGGNSGNFRGRMNQRLQRGSMINQAGINPRKMGSRLGAAVGTVTHDQALEGLEKNADMAAIKNNTQLLRAGMHGNGTEADVREYLSSAAGGSLTGRDLEESVAMVQRARRSMGDQNFQVAAAVGLGGTGDGYANSAAMVETIAAASGGNRALAGRMLAATRSLAGQGRVDLSQASFGGTLTQINNAIDGQTVDTAALDLETFNNLDGVSMARSRTESVGNLTAAATERINHLYANRATNTPAEQLELGQLTARLENARDAATQYAAPSRVEVINQNAAASATPRVIVQEENRLDNEVPLYDNVTRLRVENVPEAKGYRDERQTRGQNPNDPNNQQ